MLFLFFLTLATVVGWSQNGRIQQLKNKLESLVVDAPGLSERADINVSNIALSDFLQLIANAHKVNLNIDPELNQIIIKNNFSNATVADILLFVCKEYDLTIDFTGNILSIRKYIPPSTPKKQRMIPISFDGGKNILSVDLQHDTLYVAFKQIMDKTGKNLVFAPGMENILLTSYIQNMPFDSALDKIAFANNLIVTKTRDNYYLFEKNDEGAEANVSGNKNSKNKQNRPTRRRRSNFFFEVNASNLLNVDFENTPISNIVYDIGHELKQNMFTSSPLNEAGSATVKANNISFDLLLNKVLENTDFTYKKTDSIYYFGKKDQISLRDAVVIPLMHRSIEVMSSSGRSGRQAGRNSFNSTPNLSRTSTINTNQQGFNNTNRQPINTNRSSAFSNRSNQLESLISILPDDVIKDLKVSVDIELNSFIVSGPSQNIQRFKEFIAYIDKPVPVLLIEVMILEVNKSATVETGISWGIGDKPTTTQGDIFPSTDLTLGANTVNRIIGGFNGFGSFNLGQVVPNFFAKLKALESNGDIKIRSAPKLSALNGHRANLSIGETTYYAVTQRDIIGSQNPQTSTITNFYPIDAELAINIKPLVSGDGHITLDINVIQSNFNGKKVAEEAPPGVNSREFNSIIRVKDQDLVILGGLEEKIKNDSGSGVPFLARIPIIKWFFSKRKREDTKKKLTILIKPTIIK
ncbi:MAG TPA: general secretion pathway protein GspD [Flavobacteriia bacterium]|nr:general secretion pathway protein GspD [Flavobacteriia bacterium]